MFDAVPEEPTIREAGDRVVERLVLELLLEELALADVASVHDDPAHVRIERQVGPEALDVEPPAVAVAPAELDQLGRVVLLAGEFGEQGHDAGHVVGMDEVFDEPRAEELLDLIAHDALDRRALIADRGVREDHSDHVRGVLHQRREPRLALAEVRILGEERALHRERGLRRERLQAVPQGDGQFHGRGDRDQPAELIEHEQRRQVEELCLGARAEQLTQSRVQTGDADGTSFEELGSNPLGQLPG